MERMIYLNELILADYENISFKDSLNMFYEFSVRAKDSAYLPPIEAQGNDFGADFPGGLIHKPRYTNCRFYESSFKASNGAFSIFKDCYWYDCYFEGSNFNYSNFEGCHFVKNKQFSIDGAGFNFSIFYDCHFNGIDFSGISFRDIYVEKCTFENCNMKNSSFERATLKNVKFKDMDLRHIGIRHCKFTDITFENIIFPILDLTNNIGLFPNIESQPEEIRFSLGYKKEVSYDEAKKLLIGLMPYYKETKQYFPMINVMILNNDTNNVLKLFPIAIKYSLEQHDFDALQNLCQLIVSSEFFNNMQLRWFYEYIGDHIKPESFPYNLQKSYTVYMNNIKSILIENPQDHPCATITLTTTINCKTLNLLPGIIEDIENTIKNINPMIKPCIQLTHHSPYEICIILYSIIPELLTICQTFYYAFGGMKSFLDIRKSKHEKAVNKAVSVDTSDIILDERSTNVNLSIGPFKFSKETKAVVKKVEYYIN